MYTNDFENFPTGFWKRIKSRKVPYEKMSKLGKRIYEARKYGLSYGRYMALLEAGQLPEEKKMEEEKNVRHFWGI